MRLLVHRGQVLLLLVVGVLAGVAVAGVCLEMDGVSVFGVLRADELFSPSRSQLPSQIVIGAAAAPTADAGLAGSSAAAAAPTAPSKAVQAAPTPAVVPGAVYVYPPDDHGGHDSGHGGRGG